MIVDDLFDKNTLTGILGAYQPVDRVVAEDDAGDVEQRMINKIAKYKERLAQLKKTDPAAYKREMEKRKTSSKVPPVSTFEAQGVAEGTQVNELFGFGQDLEKQIAKKETELKSLKAKLASKTATNAGIQTGDVYAIDPDTGKPYEKEKLAQMYGSGATTAQTPAPAPAPTTSNVTKPTNMTSVANNPAAFNATNVMQMPGMEKYATPTAPAKPANFGASPAGYGKVTQTFKSPTAQAPAAPAAPTAPKAPKVTSGGPTPDEQAKLQARIAAAAKAQPVAETIKQVKKMLETVQTRDDVAFIKKYIDRQSPGKLSESADAQRSRLLSEVTRIGALRRRKHSQQMAG